jgi:hypothetical protein
MGLFLIGPLAEDSATKLKRSQLNVCTVYGVVLFSLLSLKFVPGWPAIFVSTVIDNSKVWAYDMVCLNV